MPRKKSVDSSSSFDGLHVGISVGAIAGGSPWGDVDPIMLSRAITALTSCSYGVILGVTRDGGAMSMTILAGVERKRLYEHESDAMNAALEAVAEWAENVSKIG